MIRWCLFLLIALSWIADGQDTDEITAASQNGHSKKPSVVFDRIISFPEFGTTDVILLRNIGDTAVDLRGWWLSDSRKDKNNPERSYIFAYKKGCEAFSGIPAGGVLELTPLRKANPCGIPFGVSIEDELNLYDANDSLIAYASWDWSLQGLALRRMPDGSYQRMQENHSVKRVLEEIPDQYLFRDALKATELFWKLDKGNGGSSFPKLPFESINDALPYQLPSSIPVDVDSSKWPVQYDTGSFDSVPGEGPYTVLAPTSQAWKEFFQNWEPAKGLSREEIFQLPEFRDILKAHIIPGGWMSGYIFHNTELPSTSGANILALKDGTGGKIKFHSSCIDIAPPGDFTCPQQLEFGKCDRPYISGAGYCLVTCNACQNCHDCAEVVQPDIYAANGFVHILNKVIIPQKPSQPQKALEDVEEDHDSSTTTGDGEPEGLLTRTVVGVMSEPESELEAETELGLDLRDAFDEDEGAELNGDHHGDHGDHHGVPESTTRSSTRTGGGAASASISKKEATVLSKKSRKEKKAAIREIDGDSHEEEEEEEEERSAGGGLTIVSPTAIPLSTASKPTKQKKLKWRKERAGEDYGSDDDGNRDGSHDDDLHPTGPPTTDAGSNSIAVGSDTETSGATKLAKPESTESETEDVDSVDLPAVPGIIAWTRTDTEPEPKTTEKPVRTTRRTSRSNRTGL